MNVLITGGAGFIGSHLARRLLTKGHGVWIADNLTTGRRENVPDGAVFRKLDVSRPETLSKLSKEPLDAVCHLAAQSSGPASADMPYADLQVNAASTLLLSRWCLERGIRRFLYASSMAVYGNPEASPVAEAAACVPVSYYGVSKLASEHLLRLAVQDGLSVTCFRMFSVYGPGQNLENLNQGMVSIFLAYLLGGGPVPVTGSLERFRDFIYIDDVIEAWLKALGMKGTPSFCYNLGYGVPVTVRALLAALMKAMELPKNYPVRELPGKANDQFGLYADIGRAKTDLGWKPVVELKDGLRQMVQWAKTVKIQTS